MAHFENAFAGFTHHCKRFRKQVIQGLTVRYSVAKFIRFCAQSRIVKSLHVRLEFVDTLHDFHMPLYDAVIP